MAFARPEEVVRQMRNLVLRGIGRSAATRWAGGAAVVVTLTGTAMAVGPAVASAQARPARAASAPATMMAPSKSAVVVKERVRAQVGKILVTTKGRALYVLPHGTCASSCLTVWPRLVMPKGKTVPKGATCLGTANFGTNHRRQVTYRKMRLYTFASDSGTSVNGNNFEGFKVAKVVRCHR
jgi:predicted lipoprotein with Yx(FWY)xxD motif